MGEVNSGLIRITAQDEQELHFTAWDKAGTVTIKAFALNEKYGSEHITFSIISPNGLKILKEQEIHHYNVLDAGFIARFVLLPTHVNFQQVYIRELESLGYGGTGLLKEGNGQAHGRYKDGHSLWIKSKEYQVGIGTIMEREDLVYGGQNEFCPKHIPDSKIYLKIPFE